MGEFLEEQRKEAAFWFSSALPKQQEAQEEVFQEDLSWVWRYTLPPPKGAGLALPSWPAPAPAWTGCE